MDGGVVSDRYDVVEPPAQVTDLNLVFIEGLVLHSQLHPCLPSTGGVGKVLVTKVRVARISAVINNRRSNPQRSRRY